MMDLMNGCVDCACTYESEALENAWKILTASKKRNFVAVQVSPAVRVSIGEKFGLARGEDGVGKVVAALELLGADVVVDTAIASDALTLLRLKALRGNKETGKGLPVYSSECSAWIAHAQEKYPEIELLPTATTVCAKLLKKHYNELMLGKKIRVIALEMDETKKSDPGVDVVLTVDELGYLLGSLEINVRLMKKKPLTAPLGIGSGAGYIMAASGGDAEALARCLITEKNQLNFRKFEYSGLYGKQTRREAIVTADGEEWKFAVVDSLEAADALIVDVQAGIATYDYVEVTAFAGGQIGMGCDLASENGEMTRRLRKLGLKYLDQSRAARSADVSAAAASVLKKWNALCRSGEADAYDVIDEIVEDFDEVEEVIEEVAGEEPVEVVETVEETIEEAPADEVVEESVEEPVEEVVEEVIEEPVEEPVEETPADDSVEDVFEEEVIEEVLEVFEEEPAEEVETVEEISEPVEEEVTETVEEVAVAEVPTEEPVVEEVAEEVPTEEPVVEEAEEVPAEEPVVEEVVEEVPTEEPVVEEVAEEAPAEEPVTEEAEEVMSAEKEAELMKQVSAEELAEEMKHVVELLDVAEEDLTIAQKLARAHYYRRLSTKERRKLKRMRKKMRNSKK